jgi:hypothetical protein
MKWLRSCKKNILYAKYIVLHKYYVLRAGLVVGAPLWRLLKHDWSKLTSTEWTPYANWFYGTPEEKDEAAFKKAWKSHIARNDHHYEWYMKAFPKDWRSHGYQIEIPDDAFLEMVADWSGAGRAIHGNWSPRKWFDEKTKIHKLFPEYRQVQMELLFKKLEQHFGE